MKTNEIIETRESETITALTLDAAPGFKVQIRADNCRDPKSAWGAFATGNGASLTYFAGKSYKSRAGVVKAATSWLQARAG